MPSAAASLKRGARFRAGRGEVRRDLRAVVYPRTGVENRLYAGSRVLAVDLESARARTRPPGLARGCGTGLPLFSTTAALSPFSRVTAATSPSWTTWRLGVRGWVADGLQDTDDGTGQCFERVGAPYAKGKCYAEGWAAIQPRVSLTAPPIRSSFLLMKKHITLSWRIQSTIALVAAAFAFVSSAEAAVVWSGRVVDIRTGLGLPNIKVDGGAKGRQDLTPRVSTSSIGEFAVTYETALDLNSWVYYQLTCFEGTAAPKYFTNYRITSVPTETLVQMVPRNGFIRGVVVDQDTGWGIGGATVAMGITGAQWQSMTADASGYFQFQETPVYQETTNYEEGIPLEQQIPHETWEHCLPYTNYWVEAMAPGYKTFGTTNANLTIKLTSSVSPDLHTFVILRVPRAGTTAAGSATTQINGPNALLRWLAGFFTPAQLADPAITGAVADPDSDGLSNEQEFAASTEPNDPDTDADTLPDAWEVGHGTQPLVPDATADPDGDGFVNRLEYIFQTDPGVASSKPEVAVSIRRAVRVDYPTLAGAVYQLQQAPTVDGPWENTGTPFEGHGAVRVLYFDADPRQAQFYRVVINLP